VVSFGVVKFLTMLVLPPTSLVVGLAVGGMLLLCRLRRLGWLVLTLAVAEPIVLSLPAVSGKLTGVLEDRARTAAATSAPCCYDAIVVLAGGVRASSPLPHPRLHLSRGADRVLEGARLYHAGAAPTIIVSGAGTRDGLPSEADAMRQFLVELGVPALSIVVDEGARNTLETIENVGDLLKRSRVAVVTSGYHMSRTLRLAERANLEAFAFPTDFSLPPADSHRLARWLPSMESLNEGRMALREFLALAFDYRQPRRAMEAVPTDPRGPA
jgi:uncharacterized SAM-binding protein YcdF (DUF218 family)